MDKDDKFIIAITFGFLGFIAFLIYMDRQRTQSMSMLEQKLNSLSTMAALSSRNEVDMSKPSIQQMKQRKFIQETKRMFDMR